MASTGALEIMNGEADTRTKRSRDDDVKDMCGMFYESDSADDMLGKLMPSLTRRFEAFDDDQGSPLDYESSRRGVPLRKRKRKKRYFFSQTSNLMEELKMSNEASFPHSDNKENSISDQNALRQPQHRRRGSGRVTTTRPINFDKLLTTMVSPSTCSLYKNITTALKENVSKAGLQSRIVDDFWSTERQKKISAVARRKLSGMKTPADSEPKPVEDRRTRHARSRRVGGTSRKSGIKPIKLDLYREAARISEWDQETLVEEEVAPSTRGNNGAIMSAVNPALQGNLPDFDQGRKRAVVQPVEFRAATQENIQGDGVHLRAANKSNHSPQAPSKSDSPGLLQDMDLSPGKSPLVEVPDFVCRGNYAQNPLHDPGCSHPDLIVKKFFSKEPTIADRRTRECNLEGLPWTPCVGFPPLEINLPSQHISVTSPTPPSNPLAVYMPSKHLEGDLRQRRLAFPSSPSIENFEIGGLQEEKTSDLGEMQSRDVCPGMEQEKSFIRDLESRTDLCNFERDHMSTSKGDIEVAEAGRGVVHPPEIPLHCSAECDNNNFWHDQISKGVPSLEENSLLAIFHDYPEDDDNLEVPDVNDTEAVHQEECNGTSVLRQTDLNRSASNHETSVDQDSNVKNKTQTLTEKPQATEESEAAQQNIAPSGVGTDEGSTTQTKPKRVRRKLKSDNRRSSLEDSGTTWKDGQRRSQRIRHRPLEWWRGEKLLYGRVHESLMTVIGVKRSSPGKYAAGMDDPFVVESYVPAKYNELVRFAAI